MGTPYVGEIRMFAGNFAPAGWELCWGQLVSISENETLFTLIGTTYGGDGQQTFALPDLRGRLPLHQGQGTGLSSYVIGQAGGVETVTLTVQQIPAHTHPVLASDAPGSTSSPNGTVLAKSTSADIYTSDTSTGIVSLNGNAISPTGGSQPHENMQPYLGLNFIISMFGIYPTQS